MHGDQSYPVRYVHDQDVHDVEWAIGMDSVDAVGGSRFRPAVMKLQQGSLKGTCVFDEVQFSAYRPISSIYLKRKWMKREHASIVSINLSLSSM